MEAGAAATSSWEGCQKYGSRGNKKCDKTL